jgi:hypothetical protein
VGAERADARGELAAVHAGHDDVRDHEVDRGPVLLGREQRLGRARGGEHAVAGRVEDAPRDVPHGRLVLDHEHRLVPARARRRGARLRGRGRGRVVPREVHAERRAAAGRAVDLDAAAALRDDAVHRREPEPRALAEALRGEERLEDTGARRGVHARSRVGDRELDVAARRDARGGGPARRELDLPRRDHEAPAVGHRVARVHREVHEHLLELAGIRERLREAGREVELERDVLADEAAEHLLEAARELGERRRLRLEHLAAAEREELARELLGPRRGGAHLLEIGAQGIARVQALEREVGVRADHAEQVVEVVRHAAGEAPDGLHLLRRAELLLGLVLLREIDEHAREAREAAVGVDGPVRRADEARLAGAVDEAELEHLLGAVGPGRVEAVGARAIERRAIVGVHELDGDAAEHVGHREAEALDGVVHEHDAAVEVRRVDERVEVVDEAAEALLARAEGGLGPLARGDVLLRRDEAGDGAGLVAHGGDRHLLLVERAVLAAVHELAVPLAAAQDRRPHRRVERAVVRAGAEHGRRLPDRLVAREAREPRERGVHPLDAPARVGDHDGRRRGLERARLRAEVRRGPSLGRRDRPGRVCEGHGGTMPRDGAGRCPRAARCSA